MKRIESAAVVGAGALGLMYMEEIQKALGENCYFLADEDRCAALKATDYTINGTANRFNARNPLSEDLSPDLIIVAVKNYHMEAVLPLIRAAASPGTILLSVLNGISSEARLKEAVPEAETLYAAALGMDAVKEGTVLNFSSRGKIVLGTEDNSLTVGLQRCCAFFDSCGLAHKIPEDIHKALWYKLMINIGDIQILNTFIILQLTMKCSLRNMYQYRRQPGFRRHGSLV